ncbi:MAG: LamG-like jellyroll fold domain-containing protein [Bryobacteraceae bacterium]
MKLCELITDAANSAYRPGSNHETEKNQFVLEKGFDTTVFRVARNAGIVGGALEARDLLPHNGRIFFPAKDNIAYRTDGWAGSLSVWLKTDPNTMLKSRFCDPVQITQRGAGNGGIWFDFNDAKPRDLRMGAFPAVPAGGKALAESDPLAPIIWLKGVSFKASDWHHVVMTWTGFDTERNAAQAALYVDGKLIGELKDREIAMEWDLDKAKIYIAVGYIGLLDELAVFNRALTPAEVTLLFQRPGLLTNRSASR